MAELLIKAVDATHPDAEKDARGCYKRGDIFAVYPDGTCREAPAPGSPFVLLRCATLDFAEAKSERLDEPGILRRRRFAIDLAALPAGVRSTLLANKVATVTRLQLFAARVTRDPG